MSMEKTRGKGVQLIWSSVFLKFEQIEMGGTKHTNGTKSGFGVGNFLNSPG